MTNVVKLFAGRTKRGKALPKPRDCDECGDPIETARLQVLDGEPRVKRCVSCQKAYEARARRMLAGARDDDIVIIRRR